MNDNFSLLMMTVTLLNFYEARKGNPPLVKVHDSNQNF